MAKVRSEEAAAFKQGVVTHAYNPFTLEVEARRLQIRGPVSYKVR